MANTTLNAAIRTALMVQFKKDAPEAFNIIKKAGYEVYKYGGDWAIKNPTTKRFLYLRVGYKNITVCGYIAKERSFKNKEDLEKFDFVNCLNTSYNDTWNKIQQYNANLTYGWIKSNAYQKYDLIKQTQHFIKYYQERIDKVQKEIQDLQKELMRYAVCLADEKKNLENTRKDLGLKK